MNSLELTATTPAEMQQAQSALIHWCEQKIASVKQEWDELKENLSIAVRNKWKTSTLKRHSDLAGKRLTFYEKIKAALEAGYCIVPHFPTTVFAIRTDKKKPAEMYSVEKLTYYPSNEKWQDPKILPAGEGEYQNPLPVVEVSNEGPVQTQHGERTEYHTWAENWKELEFPINMAKPRIMEATERAMALKVFDEMGILPDPHPKKDPLIVGTIIDGSCISNIKWKRRIHFIVAWHLNVRDL